MKHSESQIPVYEQFHIKPNLQTKQLSYISTRCEQTDRTASATRTRAYVQTTAVRNIGDHGRTPRTSRTRADKRPRVCRRRAAARTQATCIATRSPLCATSSTGARGSAQARGAPSPRDCHGGTPAGPPKGTQTPLWCRPQNGRGPERARGDNASRDRIALCGGAVV